MNSEEDKEIEQLNNLGSTQRSKSSTVVILSNSDSLSFQTNIYLLEEKQTELQKDIESKPEVLMNDTNIIDVSKLTFKLTAN